MTKLRCLGQEPTPPTLEADLRTWVTLSAAARENYGELLLPNLAPKIDERVTAKLREVVERLNIDALSLIPSVKACRTLMRGAAARNLSVEAFTEDVMALVADEPELVTKIVGYYEQARPLLRGEIVSHTVAEHGRLATEVAWRVDHITRSQRGNAVDAHVAVFTFHYQEGRNKDQERSFTLQFLPEQVAALQRACARILERPKPPN